MRSSCAANPALHQQARSPRGLFLLSARECTCGAAAQFTKQVLVTILITCAGMLALKMDPQDHTGDRVANILLAALICAAAG